MSTGRWEFDENGNVRYVDETGAEAQPPTDGSYHYSYRKTGEGSYRGEGHGTPGNTAHRRQSKKSDSGWHWVLIILGFIAAWPVGLVLLLLELTGRWPGSQDLSRQAKRAVTAARDAAGQARAQADRVIRESQGQARPAQAAAGNYGQTTAQVQERLAKEKAAQAQARQAEQTRNEEAVQDARQAAARKKAARAQRKAERRARRDDGAAYGLGHTRLFNILGGILTGLFGFAFVMELIDSIRYFFGWGDLLENTVPLLALALIGVTLILMAGSRKRKLKKFQKYLSMIGPQTQISIPPLAEAMGVPEKRVEKDLEEMLERDFWDDGYVDAARQMLVLGGHLDAAPEPEIDQEAPETDDQAASTLRHIRQVNDAIADAEMSDKIYRIEELTAKIFQLLEERPEKAGELRSFMNYYLPQTLKILESYSKLEAQGIEGENITEAKEKIEGMMDKLVDGYETQLDKLFADDVLDISADLKVMEQMLEKDGLAMDELKF